MKRKKQVEYVQKELFIDEVRTRVCANIRKMCMQQNVQKNESRQVKRTPSVKQYLKIV